MPAPIMYAHKLVLQLASVRKKQPNLMPYLRPDAKSQVTVEYDTNGKPARVDTEIVSTQHDPDVTQKRLKKMSSRLLSAMSFHLECLIIKHVTLLILQ